MIDQIICSVCETSFEEAECEDWSNPRKSFICPSCNAALIPLQLKDTLGKKEWWIWAGRSFVAMVPCIVLARLTLDLVVGGSSWFNIFLFAFAVIIAGALARGYVLQTKPPVVAVSWAEFDASRNA